MSIVIIGGGQAAGAAIRKLRELGHAGQVVLVSDESHLPYERPPLSKEYLWRIEQDLRCIAPGRQSNERMLLDSSATSIDPNAKTVTCANGTVLPYEALLLATGGRPRRLSIPGSDLANVHCLRTALDAGALRRSLDHCAATGQALLVVGGSWIGLEVAAGAREAGIEVVLLERGDRLCSRTLPTADAEWMQSLHTSRGVAIRLRTTLERLEGSCLAEHAHLSDGSRLKVGAVIAGIGIAPNVELAHQCGVHVRNGVVIDRHGRTSISGIYAAGDVAEQTCAWHGESVRIETWDNANRQGEAAAAHIAGVAGEGPASVPWFWSDQYRINLQVVGSPLKGNTVISSQSDGPQRLSIHLRGGAVVGAVGINRARDMRRLRKLLGEQALLDEAALQQHGFSSH